MPESTYPVCKKCNDGNLVPFNLPDNKVVYYCTNCGVKFSAYLEDPTIDEKQVFREKAIYISDDKEQIEEAAPEEAEEPKSEGEDEAKPEEPTIEPEK